MIDEARPIPRRWLDELPHVPKSVVWAGGLAVAAVAAGFAAQFHPVIALGLTAIAVAFFVPAVGRVSLLVLFVLIPSINPPLAGVGTGRFYLAHVLILFAVASAGGVAILGTRGFRLKARYGAVLGIALLYTLVVGLLRSGQDIGTLGWTYKPLQPFLVAIAVALLTMREPSTRWIRYIAWGGIIGCGLVVLNLVYPSIDPFRLPSDIPFLSTIGSFKRATGAFVYPNNLGTFCAYLGVLALAVILLDRPPIPRPLAWALGFFAVVALLATASRAAGGGLLLGAGYLVSRARIDRKLVVIGAAALIGVGVLVLATSSTQARSVVKERIQTTTRQSLTAREHGLRNGLQQFLASPWIGKGASDSRLDNSYILYLQEGGVVGAALLLALGVAAWGPLLRRNATYREMAIGLGIVFASTAMLQDTFGQTLSSWLPGALIGIGLGATLGRRFIRRDPVPAPLERGELGPPQGPVPTPLVGPG